MIMDCGEGQNWAENTTVEAILGEDYGGGGINYSVWLQ